MKWSYGGIGCVADKYGNKANYSNSDVTIESNISKADNITSIDGSTAFTSDQMQTPAFLEELNMYSMLEMDGPVWAQDAVGGYPYIAKLYETSGVGTVSMERSNVCASIYSLSGQQLTAPRKGMNIIDGRKVVVR